MIFRKIILLLIFSLVGTSLAWSQSGTRFTASDKGTVLDNQTGLMWQQQDSFHEMKRGMNWYEALEYVDRMNRKQFAGYSDWRLPTLKEIANLWDATRPLKSKDEEPIGLPKEFSGGGSYYLWTSSERNLDNAWYFGLGQREDYFNLKETGDLDQGVKLVRDHKK